MKQLIVRAGKYSLIGVLFIACFLIFIPWLILLSVFGFAVLLPLGCALAGFLYLRKNVWMLERKVPTPILVAGCSSSGGRPRPLPQAVPTAVIHLPVTDVQRREPLPPAGPISSTDLPLTVNVQEIETSEAVDQEFDAVLISSDPWEVQLGCSD